MSWVCDLAEDARKDLREVPKAIQVPGGAEGGSRPRMQAGSVSVRITVGAYG